MAMESFLAFSKTYTKDNGKMGNSVARGFINWEVATSMKDSSGKEGLMHLEFKE